jgi:hypothetical protein
MFRSNSRPPPFPEVVSPMQMPDKSPDLYTAKLKIATRFRNFEEALMQQLSELATSGFADARLCAMARADFERAFLELEKAIRLGTPDDYAKQPMPPDAKAFRPPTDPIPHKSVGPQSHIEWRDANPNSET